MVIHSESSFIYPHRLVSDHWPVKSLLLWVKTSHQPTNHTADLFPCPHLCSLGASHLTNFLSFSTCNWCNLFHCVYAKSCPILCNSMDCSPPDSSVHEISQERIPEWVVISFSSRGSSQPEWVVISFSSRGSSQPRKQTRVSCISCIGRQILYHCTT